MLYISITKGDNMKVIEIRVLISHIQGWNDCKSFVMQEYPNKNIFAKDELPKDYVVVNIFEHNISHSCLPSWGNTLYVEV